MRLVSDSQVVEIVEGDITHQQVDAVVNAANSRLAGGGGVDGAIHRQGGPTIMEETRKNHPQGCPTGSAVITGAGSLPAKYVIHAVGPVWHGGDRGEADQLASAYRTALRLANDHRCRTVAFPALSAGAYGYPVEQAGEVALQTTLEFLSKHRLPEAVRFVLFGSSTYQTFRRVLQRLDTGDPSTWHLERSD